jgi:hypothetical protein
MKEFLLCNKAQLFGQGENAVQNGRAKITTLETYHPERVFSGKLNNGGYDDLYSKYSR